MSFYLFDTNAIVYLLNSKAPQHQEVFQLTRAILASGDDDIYALSSCLNEAYYALRTHYMDEASARERISWAARLFTLIDLTSEIVFTALASNEPDYEDGLVRAAAERFQVDAIVAYDKKAFKGSFVRKATAAELLSAR